MRRRPPKKTALVEDDEDEETPALAKKFLTKGTTKKAPTKKTP